MAGSLAVDLPVQRAARAAPPRRELTGPASTGVQDPGTIAAAVTGVAFAIGGQRLVRYEVAVILRRGGPGMSSARFDELIHAPTRLSLVAFLAATEWAEFAVLRDGVGLSDSALSKQLSTLSDAGYVEIRKAFVGKRPRTSARLTPAGRTAFDQHVQEIVARAGRSVAPAHRGG